MDIAENIKLVVCKLDYYVTNTDISSLYIFIHIYT